MRGHTEPPQRRLADPARRRSRRGAADAGFLRWLAVAGAVALVLAGAWTCGREPVVSDAASGEPGTATSSSDRRPSAEDQAAAPPAAHRRGRAVPPTAVDPGARPEQPEPASDADSVAVMVRVLDPAGLPAEGVRVSVLLGDDRLVFDKTDEVEPSAVDTDADGRARFRVRRSALGLSLYASASRRDLLGTAERAVGAGSGDIELRLVRGEFFSGEVRRPDGTPCRYAEVTLLHPGQRIASVRLGDAATFRFGPYLPMSEGQWAVLLADHPEFLTETLKVPPDAPSDGLVLTLRPAVLLRGRVVDEAGAPVRNTWLLFHDGNYGDEQRLQSGDDGRFTARMSPTAAGDMPFFTKGYAGRLVRGALLRAGPKDLGDVVVRRGAPLRGVVVDEDGSPVASAHLDFVSEEIGVAVGEATTDASGTFESPPVGTGSHDAIVRAPSEHATSGDWEPAVLHGCLAGATGLRVVLLDGPGVEVRLHAAADAAEAEPRRFDSVGGSTSPTGASDLAGTKGVVSTSVHTLRFARTPGEVVDVVVHAKGFAEWRAEGVRVPEGRAVVLDARLRPAAGDER